MKTKTEIEQRIEALLDEAYRAEEQANEIAVTSVGAMTERMVLERIAYSSRLAADCLRWVVNDGVLYL